MKSQFRTNGRDLGASSHYLRCSSLGRQIALRKRSFDSLLSQDSRAAKRHAGLFSFREPIRRTFPIQPPAAWFSQRRHHGRETPTSELPCACKMNNSKCNMTPTAVGRVHWWKIATRENHLNRFMEIWVLIRSTPDLCIFFCIIFKLVSSRTNYFNRHSRPAVQRCCTFWSVLRFKSEIQMRRRHAAMHECKRYLKRKLKKGERGAHRELLITWMNERHCRVNEFSLHQPFPTKERSASCPPEVSKFCERVYRLFVITLQLHSAVRSLIERSLSMKFCWHNTQQRKQVQICLLLQIFYEMRDEIGDWKLLSRVECH